MMEICTVCSWRDLAPILKWGLLFGLGAIGMVWLAPAGLVGIIAGRIAGAAIGAGIWYGLGKLGLWDRVESFTTLGQSGNSLPDFDSSPGGSSGQGSSSSRDALQDFEGIRRKYHPPLGPPP